MPLTLFDPGEGGEVEQGHAAGADEQHEDEDEGDGGVRPGLPAQDVDAPVRGWEECLVSFIR